MGPARGRTGGQETEGPDRTDGTDGWAGRLGGRLAGRLAGRLPGRLAGQEAITKENGRFLKEIGPARGQTGGQETEGPDRTDGTDG